MEPSSSPDATPAQPRRRRRTVRVALSVGVTISVLVVVTGSLAGWSRSWNWLDSQWRLDVGAPEKTSPYPERQRPPTARLVAAGDVGTGGESEYRTARAIDRLEATSEFDALLLLGDNVYPSGDPGGVANKVFDPFEGVLDGPTDLVAALGNHDVRTGDGRPLLKALGQRRRWFSERYGPVHVVVVDSTRAADPDQRRWLNAELNRPIDAAWTVVIQHHPPFSAGFHQSHEPSRRNLVPFYRKAGVDLVLAGHDHDYQRSKPQNGVTYVVSGGAATLRDTGRADFTATSASTYNFVELAAHPGRLEVRAVNQDGRVIDAFNLT